jgi:hypothetical protein
VAFHHIKRIYSFAQGIIERTAQGIIERTMPQTSTTPTCPLCGTSDGQSLSDHTSHLKQQARALETGSIKVSGLRGHMDQMCQQCQLLMTGITSEDDRLELRDRIFKELEPPAAEPRHPTASPGEAGAGAKREHEHLGSRRDPEERPASSQEETREKMLDKTLADSFPTSDPPSSIPDPSEDDSMAA